MAFSSPFHSIASGTVVRLDRLGIDWRYTVMYAQRLVTQYGPKVLLTLQTKEIQSVKVFMPK